MPPGFTITTELCTYFYENGKTYPPDLAAQVDAAIAEVGRHTGHVFGDAANPLLLSVRSGARVSMPGMMDTVLNLGLNDTSVVTLAKNVRRRTLRLGQLPPLHPDVFARRARGRTTIRGHPRAIQGRQGLLARHRPQGRRLAQVIVDTRPRSRRRPASPSRRSPRTSSGARSAPSSRPG